MSEICPFRGIRYNQEIVKDLTQSICPPYDVITPVQQRYYYEKSNYNAIRLEYPLPVVARKQSTYNKYSGAAITLQQWLKERVLKPEDYPAFYLHDQYFSYLGERRRRRGLIAHVKLEPWGNNIYPHEQTFSKAKDDRLQLMRACQAHFSPLFALYQDSEGKIAKTLTEASRAEPVIEFAYPEERHVVWAITDPAFICRLSEFLAKQSLYMADGHHRYETALAYQQERTHISTSKTPMILTGKEAFNYVMMTLVDFSDPGLVILPVHRLVRDIATSALAQFENQLKRIFALKYVPLTENLIRSLEYRMDGGALLGILGLVPQSLVLLKQRPDISFEDMMPRNHSLPYKNFSISLLNHLILDRMLGIKQDSENIAYTVDIQQLCQQVKDGKYQLAFLSNSPSPEIIKIITGANDRMPRKSTYFYPKLPTGLIMNSLSTD